jgi:hypothetical protein
MKLEINNKKNYKKFEYMETEHSLLNDLWIIEEIKKEIKKNS